MGSERPDIRQQRGQSDGRIVSERSTDTTSRRCGCITNEQHGECTRNREQQRGTGQENEGATSSHDVPANVIRSTSKLPGRPLNVLSLLYFFKPPSPRTAAAPPPRLAGARVWQVPHLQPHEMISSSFVRATRYSSELRGPDRTQGKASNASLIGGGSFHVRASSPVHLDADPLAAIVSAAT